MARLIDADALKESIDNCDICNICPDKDVRCSYDCGFPDVLDYKWEKLIDAQPTIDAVSEWIPCEERLPSKDGEYLTTYRWTGRSGTEYEEVWVMDFDHGRFTGEETGIILAWMPLPKPYEETNQ